MTQSFYPYSQIYMTDTSNSPAKKSSDGISTQSKDSQGLDAMTRPRLKAGEWYETGQLSPEEAKRRQIFYQKMAYIEMKKLRPKHPHC